LAANYGKQTEHAEMAEKQKPNPRIVTVAAKAMKHPETVTQKEIKRMAARILDDQKNDPEQHKPARRK
jgi:hypothetical protein